MLPTLRSPLHGAFFNRLREFCTLRPVNSNGTEAYAKAEPVGLGHAEERRALPPPVANAPRERESLQVLLGSLR